MNPPPVRSPRVKPGLQLTTEHATVVEDYIRRSVPDKHKLATQRALRGQISKTSAIKIKCLQCCGYQREEVAVCSVLTCALNPVRPYQQRKAGGAAV